MSRLVGVIGGLSNKVPIREIDLPLSKLSKKSADMCYQNFYLFKINYAKTTILCIKKTKSTEL